MGNAFTCEPQELSVDLNDCSRVRGRYIRYLNSQRPLEVWLVVLYEVSFTKSSKRAVAVLEPYDSRQLAELGKARYLTMGLYRDARVELAVELMAAVTSLEQIRKKYKIEKITQLPHSEPHIYLDLPNK